MAHWTYEPALEQGVFPHEGGYTNHPADPGGPTNWGITIYDARAYWKPGATAADVQLMPKSVAEAIYWPHYAVPLRYDDLPAGVDYAVLDYGINSGIARAAKVLQRLVGVAVDGRIGANTLAAVAKRDPAALINAICAERLAFLHGLSTWPVFGVGWGRRVAEVKALALDFAKTDAEQKAGGYATRLMPSPSITPTQPGEVMAKGQVPAPVIAKKIVTVGGGGTALGAGGGFHDWLAAHPYEAGAIAIGGVIVLGGTVYAINRWHRAKQEAPTPGFGPVPVAA